MGPVIASYLTSFLSMAPTVRSNGLARGAACGDPMTFFGNTRRRDRSRQQGRVVLWRIVRFLIVGLLLPGSPASGVDQLGQPQRCAGVALPPVCMCRVAAPVVGIAVVSNCQSSEDERPLRAPGQLAHERLEHVIGGVRRRIEWHAGHLVTSRRDRTLGVRADHGDWVMWHGLYSLRNAMARTSGAAGFQGPVTELSRTVGFRRKRYLPPLQPAEALRVCRQR